MIERLNIASSAATIAVALHRALKAKIITKIGADDVRAAVAGYLAAGPHIITKYDTEKLIEAVIRKMVEMVG